MNVRYICKPKSISGFITYNFFLLFCLGFKFTENKNWDLNIGLRNYNQQFVKIHYYLNFTYLPYSLLNGLSY